MAKPPDADELAPQLYAAWALGLTTQGVGVEEQWEDLSPEDQEAWRYVAVKAVRLLR